MRPGGSLCGDLLGLLGRLAAAIARRDAASTDELALAPRKQSMTSLTVPTYAKLMHEFSLPAPPCPSFPWHLSRAELAQAPPNPFSRGARCRWITVAARPRSSVRACREAGATLALNVLVRTTGTQTSHRQRPGFVVGGCPCRCRLHLVSPLRSVPLVSRAGLGVRPLSLPC